MNDASSCGNHNKGQRFPAEPLSRGEVVALMKHCSTRGPTGLRNRALIVVLYRGGLRCAEALALKPKDVDVDRCTIRVLDGKGNVARTSGIDASAAEIIARYMETRRITLLRLGGSPLPRNAPLFCTLSKTSYGRRMHSQYVRLWLPRLKRKAGIDKRVHAHGLRHTLATELAVEGVAVPLIQRQLGHSNVATTDTYLKGLAPAETLAEMRQREWKPTG